MPYKQLQIEQIESDGYQFTQADFDLSQWSLREGSIALTGGRGASQKIIIQGQAYVLRHYLRGGLIARLLHDQYVWTGVTRSRPFLETKVIGHALSNRLPVPEVMAYCIQQSGLFYQASIISRFIKNEGTLATFLYDNQMANRQWIELGALIKRLHQANIFHADLNANNILIDKQGMFYIIDFDKAEIIDPVGSAAEKNVQRLLRSLKKIQMLREQQKLSFNFTGEQWECLLQGYK